VPPSVPRVCAREWRWPFFKFLENDVEGYSSSSGEEDDVQLRILLTTSFVQEVG
jgi:hypothetical protein